MRGTGLRSQLKAWTREQSHFLALGIGFMLLEVTAINRASLLLGNTWWVTAIIISSILTITLASNYAMSVALRYQSIRDLVQPLAYLLLLIMLLIEYFVPLSFFSNQSLLWRSLGVGLFTTIPLFFSGIIFIASFARCEAKSDVFGANLFGSLLGGSFQTAAFLVGLSNLLLLAGGFYLISFLLRTDSGMKPVSS